jgi:4-hydroxyphenylpyruvate dioxygenase-like putative hemolysin
MMIDYARLLSEFQRYDKSDRSIEKVERFSHYINEQALFYNTLLDILKNNNADIDSNKRTVLSEQELNYLNKAIKLYINRERRTADTT